MPGKVKRGSRKAGTREDAMRLSSQKNLAFWNVWNKKITSGDPLNPVVYPVPRKEGSAPVSGGGSILLGSGRNGKPIIKEPAPKPKIPDPIPSKREPFPNPHQNLGWPQRKRSEGYKAPGSFSHQFMNTFADKTEKESPAPRAPIKREYSRF